MVAPLAPLYAALLLAARGVPPAVVAVLALRALRPRRAGGLDVQAAARLDRTHCAALRGATPRSARSSTCRGSSARAASTAPAQSGRPWTSKPPPASSAPLAPLYAALLLAARGVPPAVVAVLALRALRPRRAGGLDVQAAARLQRTPCAALRGATPRSARSSTSGGSSARAASTAPAQSGRPGRPSRRPPRSHPLRRSTRRYSSQREQFNLRW